jgi:hypothetical protein
MPLSSGYDGHFLGDQPSSCFLVFLRHLRLFWYLVGSSTETAESTLCLFASWEITFVKGKPRTVLRLRGLIGPS